MKKYKSIIILLIILLTTLYISVFHFQFTLIQGKSMEPTYSAHQLVIVDKTPNTLKAGDVIVFRCDTLNSLLIKRIVATPGDEVFISNGILYVNGKQSPYALPYIKNAGVAQTCNKLPSNQYFVFGDNHNSSIDSRFSEVGYVHEDDILGSVIPQIPISKSKEGR